MSGSFDAATSWLRPEPALSLSKGGHLGYFSPMSLRPCERQK